MKLEELFKSKIKSKKLPNNITSTNFINDNRTDAELERDSYRAKMLKYQEPSGVNRGEERNNKQDWVFG
jgi:hypothetical protein